MTFSCIYILVPALLSIMWSVLTELLLFFLQKDSAHDKTHLQLSPEHSLSISLQHKSFYLR